MNQRNYSVSAEEKQELIKISRGSTKGNHQRDEKSGDIPTKAEIDPLYNSL